MEETIKSGEDCENMAEVRAGVDATDRALVDLLAKRFGYMRAAARIKQSRDAVRDEDRKRVVIDAALAHAQQHGVPIGFMTETWELLVETSIAYEMQEWDRLRS